MVWLGGIPWFSTARIPFHPSCNAYNLVPCKVLWPKAFLILGTVQHLGFIYHSQILFRTSSCMNYATTILNALQNSYFFTIISLSPKATAKPSFLSTVVLSVLTSRHDNIWLAVTESLLAELLYMFCRNPGLLSHGSWKTIFSFHCVTVYFLNENFHSSASFLNFCPSISTSVKRHP